MTSLVEVLQAQVLSLPAEMRFRLLDKLLESLDHDAELKIASPT